MGTTGYIPISIELEATGLVWHPAIGDEVLSREELKKVSILVDPQGLSPKELRENFVWLPTVEQLVDQLEARQALIYHAGVTAHLSYEAVVRTVFGVVEAQAASLREVFGMALRDVLMKDSHLAIH